MSAKRSTAADSFDGVRWDYRPEDDWVSPLVSVEKYFEAFPWDGLPDDPGSSARRTTGN